MVRSVKDRNGSIDSKASADSWVGGGVWERDWAWHRGESGPLVPHWEEGRG